MIYQIKNDHLSLSVNSVGAEITELINVLDCTKYICPEANENWEGISPVLFPNAGLVKGGANISSIRYPYIKHGFAKDLEFSLCDIQNSSITLFLHSNDYTKTICPFDFILTIKYSLEGRKLIIQTTVHNVDTQPILYSIGFHPGFSCPLVVGERAEDYSLIFENKAYADRLILRNGLVYSQEKAFLNYVDCIKIKEGMFNSGSFTLTNINFSSIKLISNVSGRYIQVDFDDYPNLVLWAPRYKPISTVCIEPWYAQPDNYIGENDLSDKPFTIKIMPGEEKVLTFSISAM